MLHSASVYITKAVYV